MQNETAEIRLEASPGAVWNLLSDPANLLRLVPPELRAGRVDSWPVRLEKGTILEFNLRMLGLPVLWVMEVRHLDAPERMVNVQRSGPYRYWEHEQRLYPHLYGTIVEDQICYEPMMGVLGLAADNTFLRPKVSRWLAYRHMQLLHWCDYGRWMDGEPAPIVRGPTAVPDRSLSCAQRSTDAAAT
jgi:uncharacterized protein